MTNHLEALRNIANLAAALNHPAVRYPIDADLCDEAGMDGNYRLLLQAARRLDQMHAQAAAEQVERD